MKGKATPVVGTDDLVQACVNCHKAHFDPAKLADKIAREEGELEKLMGQWADLPTPRAKEKARERFTLQQARIEELRHQQADAADVVEQDYREMYDLQLAIVEAKNAMRSEAGERSLRQRAQALRSILCRIDCEFTLTGKKTTGGLNNARSKLSALAFHPIVGSSRTIVADSVNPDGGFRSYGKP